MRQEAKDKIFAIAQSKPKYEGVTVGELEHNHGLNRKEIDAALEELEKEGKLQEVPLFYAPKGK
ncbi:MAG TPA: hypothetical protein VKR60_10870 [Candidatus Sulfotelmatobacter sp.]|nr:hypothetical protein [Candidatus Sulfotelmatobacter sp.]